MKSILLTSTALVAFAGAAAAETSINFSGSATLGYNDTDLTAVPENDRFGVAVVPASTDDDDFGFYSDINLDVELSAKLDNGITVTATADVDELDAEDDFGGVTLKIASDTASLTYGDVENAAKAQWSAVGDMAADGFYEQDGETVLRADLTIAGMSIAASNEVYGDELVNQTVGVTGEVGMFSFGAAYQAGLKATDVGKTGTDLAEIFALRAGVTVAGADIAVGYADNSGTNATSTGISLSYPVGGAVTLGASYVMEDDSDAADNPDDTWEVTAAYAAGAITADVAFDSGDDWALNASYAVSEGFTVYGGAVDAGEDFYVGGSYDLGSGASMMMSYADDGDNDEAVGDDDIGGQDYQVGLTVEVNFTF